MKYMVVIERSKTGYGAYVPDLPGCVAAADTREGRFASSKRRSSSILRGSVKRASRFPNRHQPGRSLR